MHEGISGPVQGDGSLMYGLIRALIVCVAVAAALSIVTGSAAAVPLHAAGAGQATRPNFVFVLTDDLSRNLVAYMPHVRGMQRRGTSFGRYVVTDSLCCPSRSSIFTGRYPHSTGVFTNKPPDGGFEVFHQSEERDTFATSLQAQGYRTAMMGKYLNGYVPRRVVDGAPRFVPPGWSDWAVAGNGYREFDYNLLVKTPQMPRPRIIRHGDRPRDYLTDVISRRGRAFMSSAARAGRPFMLELATFAPHAPYTPAPRDAKRFPNLKAPRTPPFNRPQLEGRPAWLSTQPLTAAQIQRIDRDFRKRAQSVQAVDRMIGDIQAQLRKLGVADNTYIVFTSDNGYHMGQRRLLEGKQTAWDHDIHVPLVVTGPGVPAGRTVAQLAANVDLRPTFQQLGGAPIAPNVEGRSLAAFLRGDGVTSWRNVALIEHHGPNTAPTDPDRATARQGNPPSYTALRFPDALWVQYDDPRYAPEYYDLKRDPYERRNIAAKLTQARRDQLSGLVAKLRACNNGPACQDADREE
jgi:N-acetylglucosamine-6-sulfatase